MTNLEANLFGLVVGILSLSALAITPDFLKTLLASTLAVTMGLLVKLALEWDRNRLTWKTAFIQTIFSAGVGYMVFFWLDGKGFLGIRGEVILFIMSLAAAHIVSAINSVSRDKSKTIVESLIDRIVARKKDIQVIQEEDDKHNKEGVI